MNQEFDALIEKIRESDKRYKEDAYTFVMEALNFTQKKCAHPRHVSGAELLDGMKNLLLNRYGPMTMTVLKYWGIQTTEDFGNIVFNLVENKVLSKTEEDNIETFRNAYDFEEEFDLGYRKRLHKKVSRMRSI